MKFKLIFRIIIFLLISIFILHFRKDFQALASPDCPPCLCGVCSRAFPCPGVPPPPGCLNGICDVPGGECASCPFDCTIGDCCGNGVCDPGVGEDPTNCPGDCLPPPPPPPSGEICNDKMDIVFVMDTSGSMDDEFDTLCGNIDSIVADARNQGIDLEYKILGCGNSTRPCANQSVVNYINSVGASPDSNDSEDWGPGTEDIAKYYQWREGAARVIVPMGDEGAENGCGWDGKDDDAIDEAIIAAQNNGVKVYPVIGSCPNVCSDSDCNKILDGADELASQTEGAMYRSTNPDELKAAILNIIWSTWDADGDGYVNMKCPCDPRNPPDDLKCYDCDDTDSGIIHECFYGGLVPCGRLINDPNTAIDESAPCTLCHFFVLAKRVVDYAVVNILIPLAILMIVIGGTILLTAGGDPGRVSQGKQILKATLIAIAIVLAGWIIVDTIITVLTPAGSPFQDWSTITC